MNNKKIMNAWAFYDWANSAFALVISAAVFPAYYNSVTENINSTGILNFAGFEVSNSVLYTWSFSFSVLVTAFLSPLLSGIADYTGWKKSFMKFFVILGSVSSACLFFFKGENIYTGIIFFVLANIGFNGSLVFYNAFLPEITSEDNYDKLSAKGYAFGYIGSIILLVTDLILIMVLPKFFDINENLLYRATFVSVGIWWYGFSLYSFRYLPSGSKINSIAKNILFKGYRELLSAWYAVKKLKNIKRFLFSYFFYSMGVQTVIYLAGLFGAKELKISSIGLLITILAIQIIAVAGAYIFSGLSKMKGNLFSLKVLVIIWIAICVNAYFITNFAHFFTTAAFVGLVMGGIQSLSRSTFAKLIPLDNKDFSSFFSFSEFTEKIAIVLGTGFYGLFDMIYGNMRTSILVLAVFFTLGFIILSFVQIKNE